MIVQYKMSLAIHQHPDNDTNYYVHQEVILSDMK